MKMWRYIQVELKVAHLVKKEAGTKIPKCLGQGVLSISEFFFFLTLPQSNQNKSFHLSSCVKTTCFYALATHYPFKNF